MNGLPARYNPLWCVSVRSTRLWRYSQIPGSPFPVNNPANPLNLLCPLHSEIDSRSSRVHTPFRSRHRCCRVRSAKQILILMHIQRTSDRRSRIYRGKWYKLETASCREMADKCGFPIALSMIKDLSPLDLY